MDRKRVVIVLNSPELEPLVEEQCARELGESRIVFTDRNGDNKLTEIASWVKDNHEVLVIIKTPPALSELNLNRAVEKFITPSAPWAKLERGNKNACLSLITEFIGPVALETVERDVLGQKLLPGKPALLVFQGAPTRAESLLEVLGMGDCRDAISIKPISLDLRRRKHADQRQELLTELALTKEYSWLICVETGYLDNFVGRDLVEAFGKGERIISGRTLFRALWKFRLALLREDKVDVPSAS